MYIWCTCTLSTFIMIISTCRTYVLLESTCGIDAVLAAPGLCISVRCVASIRLRLPRLTRLTEIDKFDLITADCSQRWPRVVIRHVRGPCSLPPGFFPGYLIGRRTEWVPLVIHGHPSLCFMWRFIATRPPSCSPTPGEYSQSASFYCCHSCWVLN